CPALKEWFMLPQLFSRRLRLTPGTLILASTLLFAAFTTAPLPAQDATHTFTILHNFRGAPDGEYPFSGVTRDDAGNLYGTTFSGGIPNCGISTGCGVVYKLSPDGKETILHRFTGGADGSFPYAALILDQAGNLYGTADMGGDVTKCYSEGCGTVYKV